MVETITGMSNAVIVEDKGATQYALGEVKKFILENRFINSVIKVDEELAIKRFAEALDTSLNGEVKCRLSPAYSHQSLGACEGWHSTLFSHLRLLMLQLSEQYGIPVSEIITDHPVFPWMVKHIGLIYNRFQIGQDGQSPYSRNWGQKCKSAIIAFGVTVLCQHNFHESQKLPQRLEPQWSYGVWIGRDTSNGNHLTLTSEGPGTPRDPSGRLEEYQDEFIGLPPLVTKYQSKQRADTTVQVEDVMPTLGDNIQTETATQSMAAVAASGSRPSSSNQPMEVGQPVTTPSTSTFIPSGPTGMPIPSDSPVIRPPPGLEEPVKHRLRT
eukprot:5249960-Amphidinium_carterae.4